jgi:hypothetical protein
VDVPETAMADRPDRLEDCPVRDVGPDRDRRVEAEQEHKDRRQEGPAAHARHPHERSYEETGEDQLPRHGALG